jgi:hypothetical protein
MNAIRGSTLDAARARTPSGARGLRPSWALAAGAAWVLVATALQLARQRGVPAFDSIWAEDGYLYLTDALASGPLAPLLTPYADYLQLVPRMIGGAISLLPLQAAAVAFSITPALVVSLLSLYIFHASAAVLTSLWGRVVLAGLMVVLPEAGSEVMNSAVNLQWYLLFACIWPLLTPPRSRAGSIMGSVIVGATTLTIPLSAAYAPIAVANLVRANGWRERYVPITFLVGAIVQLAVVVVAGIGDPLPRDVLILPGLYGLRVAASLLVGERWLVPLWEAFGWGLAVCRSSSWACCSPLIYCLERIERSSSLSWPATRSSSSWPPCGSGGPVCWRRRRASWCSLPQGGW